MTQKFAYRSEFLTEFRYNVAMSMRDKKNKQIEMLKYWLGILVAVFLGIGAYLASNLKELSDWLILTGSLSLVGLPISIIFINQRINRHIDDLEDL